MYATVRSRFDRKSQAIVYIFIIRINSRVIIVNTINVRLIFEKLVAIGSLTKKLLKKLNSKPFLN